MDFRLSDEQRELQDTARRFARDRLTDVARHLESTGESLPNEWVRRYAELGFLGISVSERYGGGGLGLLDALLVIEEFAKISLAVMWPIFESCVGPVRIIELFANEALKKRIVPRVCAGEIMVAASLSEPDAGTALTDLSTTATVDGDSIVLRGQKRWCTGAGHADGYVVFCRMSAERGARGIGAVYVEKSAPGLSFGANEQMMGFRGIASADIFLDDVRVSRENVVVEAGGFANLMGAFNIERLGNATMSLSLAQSALDETLTYVQDRRQFGRAIIEFQAVQMKIAEMAMRTDAARLLLYRAATENAPGLPDPLRSTMAKCFANEATREVCGAALELMGGYGYSKEFQAERRFRDAWGCGIAGGTIEIQKVNIAGALVGRRFNQRG